MSNKIKKNDRLYQDALIWMGYRYAIGLTETGEAVKQYKLFRDIEYDTPEFHALESLASHGRHSVIGSGRLRYIMRQHLIYSILYTRV